MIVPLLVLLLGFDQRLAAGTSLAAIVPTATVGVISYALTGSVAWIPALILAVGAVGGAQVGTWLLPRLSQVALRWAFVAFLAVVIVSLFLVIPSRDAVLELTWVDRHRARRARRRSRASSPDCSAWAAASSSSRCWC